MLDEVLALRGSLTKMHRDSPLLGAVPELDSIGIVNVITGLEERFGFTVADDDLDASCFATVGTLIDFVEAKLAA